MVREALNHSRRRSHVKSSNVSPFRSFEYRVSERFSGSDCACLATRRRSTKKRSEGEALTEPLVDVGLLEKQSEPLVNNETSRRSSCESESGVDLVKYVLRNSERLLP